MVRIDLQWPRSQSPSFEHSGKIQGQIGSFWASEGSPGSDVKPSAGTGGAFSLSSLRRVDDALCVGKKTGCWMGKGRK